MTMNAKTVMILCVVTAALSAAVTEQYFPKTKTVEVQRDVIQNDIQTVIKTVRLPTGEVDSTTTIVDHTKRIDIDTKTTTTASIPPNWLVSATADVPHFDLTKPAYGAQVSRRVLGPVFLGFQLNTRGEAGLSLGMEF